MVYTRYMSHSITLYYMISVMCVERKRQIACTQSYIRAYNPYRIYVHICRYMHATVSLPSSSHSKYVMYTQARIHSHSNHTYTQYSMYVNVCVHLAHRHARERKAAKRLILYILYTHVYIYIYIHIYLHLYMYVYKHI